MFDIDKSLKKMLGTTRVRGGSKDWDGDGVPNKKDCQPRNTMRQDEASYSKAKKILVQQKIPVYYDRTTPTSISLKPMGYQVDFPDEVVGLADRVSTQSGTTRLIFETDASKPSSDYLEAYKYDSLRRTLNKAGYSLTASSGFQVSRKTSVNNSYDLTKEDKKYVASLVNNFKGRKVKLVQKDNKSYVRDR